MREYLRSNEENDVLLPRLATKVRGFILSNRTIPQIFKEMTIGIDDHEHPDELTMVAFEALRERSDCTPIHLVRLYFEVKMTYGGGPPYQLWEEYDEDKAFFADVFENATFDQWMEALRYIFNARDNMSLMFDKEIIPNLLKYWHPKWRAETQTYANAILSTYWLERTHETIGHELEQEEWSALLDGLAFLHKMEKVG